MNEDIVFLLAGFHGTKTTSHGEWLTRESGVEWIYVDRLGKRLDFADFLDWLDSGFREIAGVSLGGPVLAGWRMSSVILPLSAIGAMRMGRRLPRELCPDTRKRYSTVESVIDIDNLLFHRSWPVMRMFDGDLAPCPLFNELGLCSDCEDDTCVQAMKRLYNTMQPA